MKNLLTAYTLLVALFIALSNNATSVEGLEIIAGYFQMGAIVAGCVFTGYLASKAFSYLR